MKRGVLGLVTVIAGGLGMLAGPLATPAYACSCGQATAAEYVDMADVVVEATVTDVRQPLLATSSTARVRVFLAVERMHKGEPVDDLVITTDLSEASCGFTFSRGRRYLVHVRGGETHLCSGNQDLGNSDLPLANAPGNRPAYLTAAIGVPLLAVAGATSAVLLWRRRAASG